MANAERNIREIIQSPNLKTGSSLETDKENNSSGTSQATSAINYKPDVISPLILPEDVTGNLSVCSKNMSKSVPNLCSCTAITGNSSATCTCINDRVSVSVAERDKTFSTFSTCTEMTETCASNNCTSTCLWSNHPSSMARLHSTSLTCIDIDTDISNSLDIIATVSSNTDIIEPKEYCLNESIEEPQMTSTSVPVTNLPQQNTSSRPQVDMSNIARNVLSVVLPLVTRSPVEPSPLPNLKPGLSSSIFSFIMTLIFVGVVWVIVHILFGYRGHAIVAVFVIVFAVGVLLNSFFLKLYFRFRVASGLRAARHVESSLQSVHTNEIEETPPSYASVVDLPPQYSFLQFYKQRKISKNSLKSNASSKDENEGIFYCPVCRGRVNSYGLCGSCENNLRDE